MGRVFNEATLVLILGVGTPAITELVSHQPRGARWDAGSVTDFLAWGTICDARLIHTALSGRTSIAAGAAVNCGAQIRADTITAALTRLAAAVRAAHLRILAAGVADPSCPRRARALALRTDENRVRTAGLATLLHSGGTRSRLRGPSDPWN